MQYQPHKNIHKANLAEIRDVAKHALLQLLEPLAGFVSDSGLSARDLNAIFCEAAIRSAAARQLEYADRVNISGIAATTGIPRAEISRILKVKPAAAKTPMNGSQQSTNRVLAAWHEDPRFTGPNGQPADLKIYGRGSTFETLSKKYGLGIPTRAILDELNRAGVIELIENQRIRAKASVSVEAGISERVVKNFGDRASELLSTMLFNMRHPESPKFIAGASDSSVPLAALPLFRKALSNKSADFLIEVQENLSRKPSDRVARKRGEHLARVSVTIFCHEAIVKKTKALPAITKRRNFRREP